MKVTKAMAKIIPPEKCYNVRVINNIELVVNFLDYFLLTFSCFTFTLIKKQNFFSYLLPDLTCQNLQRERYTH